MILANGPLKGLPTGMSQSPSLFSTERWKTIKSNPHIWTYKGCNNPKGAFTAGNLRIDQSSSLAQSDEDGTAAASISHQNTNITLT